MQRLPKCWIVPVVRNAVSRSPISNSFKDSGMLKPSFGRQYHSGPSKFGKDLAGANGIFLPAGGRVTKEYLVGLQPFHDLSDRYTFPIKISSLVRLFASTSASEKPEEKTSETRKDVSTVEDPFDAPTYNIPEKPVTFTEGASYSVVILAGLGIAALAGYAVFKELIFQPLEYKIFGQALKRVQDDGQVKARVGTPITGYGQESPNRAARQRIPTRKYKEFDVEHVQINFLIRGPHGTGKVYAEKFKDNKDGQWKWMYLIVEIKGTQLLLESYVPE
ncbi:Mitochondrial import inner membrane translocase subunit Tim21 [Dillenia turbinata]|uniref:Mitochondrial import inner membrane translocase subunit Tim21 n=1 Tax=Dillenia turbinata TaxID=194707 RepID=A0AAN8ZUB4_9MAGN